MDKESPSFTSFSRSLKIGLLRLSIICVWVLGIFGALYFPKWEFFPLEEKRIHVFAWGDAIDPKVLADFEKISGIKVYLSYYSSNEELQFKLAATGGENYDIVMPSDYSVAHLAKEGLLQELDHSQLHFWKDLNPILLGHTFDPLNTYSVPFEWDVYGLGINRKFFTNRTFIPSWRAIFDPSIIDYKVVINNDPIEAVLFGAFYLYGKTDTVSEQEFEGIRNLFMQQRNWVEAYTDFRADYFLATGNCPVVLTIGSYIKRAKEMFSFIDFVIPQEGSFITIENFCIPKKSKRQKYVYELLNFLYSKESIASHFETYGLMPATLSSLNHLPLEDYERTLIQMSPEDVAKFHFFKNIFPAQKVSNLWVEVKSF